MYTYTCAYKNKCWALWFRQHQPIAAQSSTQSHSEKAKKEGIPWTRAELLHHVFPLGSHFLEIDSSVGLCSRFPCFILFIYRIGFQNDNSSLSTKTILFSSDVNLSFGVLSNSKLFPSFDVVKSGLLFRRGTKSWPLKLDKDPYFLKDITAAALWAF